MARNRNRQNQTQTTPSPNVPKATEDLKIRTSDVKPEDQTKMTIPKNNTKEEVKREPETIIAEAPKDETANSADLSDRKQLGVDEAIAYAMTTPDPRATVNRLTQQRKLKEVTLTKKRLEELGH